MARVYCYPADTTGCGAYRLIFAAEALRAQGHDVTVVLPHDRANNGQGINGETDGPRLLSVQAPPDADVVVLQRVTDTRLAQAVPMLRAQGVAVVVDMDDDLTRIHPNNLAFMVLHPREARVGGMHSWHHATQACMDATLVTVSTQALLKTYAPHGRGVVLPNCVPASYLDVPRVDSDVIGWGGSVHSHPDDLGVLGPSIAQLVRAGHPFRVVGPPDGIRAALGLDREPDATGTVDLADWPAALATLGVGIAPLSDTKFNIGKSALKPLEMSALGVPWVASPRAEYRRLHDTHGIGLLAERPKEWRRHLTALAGDPGLRADMSAAGRAAATAMTIEANSWRWADAWADAYRTQRHTAASAFSRA